MVVAAVGGHVGVAGSTPFLGSTWTHAHTLLTVIMCLLGAYARSVCTYMHSHTSIAMRTDGRAQALPSALPRCATVHTRLRTITRAKWAGHARPCRRRTHAATHPRRDGTLLPWSTRLAHVRSSLPPVRQLWSGPPPMRPPARSPTHPPRGACAIETVARVTPIRCGVPRARARRRRAKPQCARAHEQMHVQW